MTLARTAGGRFDPSDKYRYFYASSPSVLRELQEVLGSLEGLHILVAVNDLTGKSDRRHLEELIENGCRVFLDSGVFWLTNRHKRAHGITMDEALSLAPDEIDGFEWLWGHYVELARAYGDQLWGYVELDQGGMENKRRTRAKLHDLGLSPIPVYHPLVDGWDYYDELAEGYDRICFGNVVQANAVVRKQLLATSWERLRRHPDVWVHLLGYTPDQNLLAFPGAAQSCDSSSWLTGIRWSAAWREKAMGKTVAGGMNPEMVYELGNSSQRQRQAGVAVSQFAAVEQTWARWPRSIDADPLPPPLPHEPDPTPGKAFT
jgi:hypothetical protein